MIRSEAFARHLMANLGSRGRAADTVRRALEAHSLIIFAGRAVTTDGLRAALRWLVDGPAV